MSRTLTRRAAEVLKNGHWQQEINKSVAYLMERADQNREVAQHAAEAAHEARITAVEIKKSLDKYLVAREDSDKAHHFWMRVLAFAGAFSALFAGAAVVGGIWLLFYHLAVR